MIPAAVVALTLSLAPMAAFAQTAPAAAPAATPAVTAACKDGSTQSGTSRRSVCRGHGGIGTPAAATTPAPAASSGEQPAPAASAAPPAPKTPKKAATPIVAQTPANPGDVWVNSKTKIYHCSGDPAYGKTKAGSFMTEAAAKAAGDRASHNKACAAS